jgi:hypothetical protein
MEVGYLADGTHTGYAQQNWSPGTPTPSFWTGLKMKANQLLPAHDAPVPEMPISGIVRNPANELRKITNYATISPATGGRRTLRIEGFSLKPCASSINLIS